MHSINGCDITLTRGDTLYLTIAIKKDGQEYIPQDGDVIRFAMKQKYKDPDDKVLINKVIPNDTLQLKIEPQDTKGLPMNKQYVYDIELTNADGDVSTFIKGILQLTEEVL